MSLGDGRGELGPSAPPPDGPDGVPTGTPVRPSIPGLLPCPPLVSTGAAWEGIVVEHNRQPRFETPEHALLQHLVTVQLGEPVRAETVADGRLRRWRWAHGDVSVVPARMPNKESWDGVTEYAAVRLEPSLLALAGGDHADASVIELVPTFGAHDPLVHHLLLALLDEVRRFGADADRLYAETMAAALSAHLLKHYAASRIGATDVNVGMSRPELRRATEYVEDNLARRNLSLAEMAEASGLSPHHFSRLFKRATGLSPHQYVIRRRVDRAKRLLAREGPSLHEVARASGFSDQAHLTRHFKRTVGATPAEYRQRSKNIQ